MPLIGTRGAASARGFGLFGGSNYWFLEFNGGTLNNYSATYSPSANVFYNVGGLSSTQINLTAINFSGQLTLQKTLSNVTGLTGQGVVSDSSGNIFIAGVFANSAVQLIKYNSSGVLQWQQEAGAPSTIWIGVGIVVDSTGNIIVAAKEIFTNNGGWVGKFNTSGTLQWQRYISAADIQINDIGIDSSNNVYLSGRYTVSGASDACVISIDSSGNTNWQRVLGEIVFSQQWLGIAVDSSANVYAVGNNNTVGLIAKYNSSGVLQWQRGTGISRWYGATTDSAGNIYAVGDDSGSSALVIKLNSSGSLQWTRSITATSIATLSAVSVYNNILYVTGNDFSAALPTDGSLTGTYIVGGLTITYAVDGRTTSTPTLTDSSATTTNTAGGLSVSSTPFTDSTPALTTTVRNI
jgi:hypothetical protein